jgi:hypothetical protein
MELLLLLFVVYVAFQAGKHYGYYNLAKIMREVAEEQGIDLEKELGLIQEQEEKKNKVDSVFKLEVEQHGELLYLFDVETDSFICQGSNVQELAKFAKDLKQVDYAAVKHGDKIFAFKNGESTEVTA